MSNLMRTMGLMLVALLVAACSSTTMSGSWSDPAFTKKAKNVYIIGISKDETRRRIFEDTFGRQLSSQGIKTFSSYRDLPSNQENDREAIIQRMTEEGCDSVIITQLIDTRKETVTSPGRVSGYSSGPYYGGSGEAMVAGEATTTTGVATTAEEPTLYTSHQHLPNLLSQRLNRLCTTWKPRR